MNPFISMRSRLLQICSKTFEVNLFVMNAAQKAPRACVVYHSCGSDCLWQHSEFCTPTVGNYVNIALSPIGFWQFGRTSSRLLLQRVGYCGYLCTDRVDGNVDHFDNFFTNFNWMPSNMSMSFWEQRGVEQRTVYCHRLGIVIVLYNWVQSFALKIIYSHR